MMATEIVEVTAAVDTTLAKANKAGVARPPEPKPKENDADDLRRKASKSFKLFSSSGDLKWSFSPIFK